MKYFNVQRIFCLCLLGLALAACATPKQPQLPTGNLALGVAPFTQPLSLADMIAGYVPDNSPPIKEEILHALDSAFAAELARTSTKTFVSAATSKQHYLKIANQENTRAQPALRTWAMVGRSLNVDILIVPQAFFWQERSGSHLGTVVPAGVVLDFFVVDVHTESLISRSHYEEIQAPLAENLLKVGDFFRRGGNWVSTMELAKEAMLQAIKELGL